MLTILICLFIAVIFPILSKLPVAIAMVKMGHYDNKHPRKQQSELEGFGARAKAAHENAFEALLMFAPGALAVISLKCITPYSEWFAIAFIVSRVLYTAMYYLDLDKLRSPIWCVGFASSVALMWQAVASQFG